MKHKKIIKESTLTELNQKTGQLIRSINVKQNRKIVKTKTHEIL